MPKPNQLAIGVTEGGPGFFVRKISRTEDKIWEAVETAWLDGWSFEQLKREVTEAWIHEVEESAKAEIKKVRDTKW